MREVRENQSTRANRRWICIYLVKEQGEAAIADKKAAQAKKGRFQGGTKRSGE